MPSHAFSAIGTDWQVDTPQPLSADVAEQVSRRVESFDATYSRFRADSLVTAVAAAGGRYEFPADSAAMFDLYDSLFAATAGAVTPLVGRSLETLGDDSGYSLTRRGAAVPAADWAREVERDGRVVTAASGVLIDVGAAGKGYLVDLVGEVLVEHGIDAFVIDASGDILARGPDPLAVALEHPLDPSMAIGVANVTNGSICASGSNRRVWGAGLHHILDGRTGEPTSDIVATWAIAGTALVADGLATALFFTSPAVLAETFDFTYVRMFANGRAECSADLDGELFS